MTTIIDLSLPIDDTLEETHAARIERIGHRDGVDHLNWVLMRQEPGGERPEGVQMTWIQDFEMDPGAEHDAEAVEGFVNQHSRHNMQIFKRVIEAER